MSRTSNPPIDEQNENPQQSSVQWLLPWHWPVGIWILLVAGFVMLLPFGIRALMLSGIPAMKDPFDVEEFVKWDVPESEDAFTYYHRATAMRKSVTAVTLTQEQLDAVFERGWTAADEGTREWLQKHKDVMDVWKQGTVQNQGLNLPLDQMNFSTLLPTIQEQREFTRLAKMEAERCISEGRLDEAWSWLRASFRSGGHTSHRGFLIQGLVAVAMHAMTAAGMERWAEQPGLTSDQLKQALADVQSDYSLYESHSNLLKAEFLAARNSLQSKQWTQVLDQGSTSGSGNPTLQTAMRMGYWVIGEPELTIRTFRQTLANQLPEMDKPLAERRKLTGSSVAMLFDPDPAVGRMPGQLTPTGIDQALRRSSLARMLMPALKQADLAMSRHAAKQVSLQVMLASQAYRRDHGEFPESLSQLVPDYLQSIPLDPQNPVKASINYRRDEPIKAVVWCVGDDGADSDGNVDVPPPGRSTDTGFILK